jgi:hypothetical protein
MYVFLCSVACIASTRDLMCISSAINFQSHCGFIVSSVLLTVCLLHAGMQ